MCPNAGAEDAEEICDISVCCQGTGEVTTFSRLSLQMVSQMLSKPPHLMDRSLGLQVPALLDMRKIRGEN